MPVQLHKQRILLYNSKLVIFSRQRPAIAMSEAIREFVQLGQNLTYMDRMVKFLTSLISTCGQVFGLT